MNDMQKEQTGAMMMKALAFGNIFQALWIWAAARADIRRAAKANAKNR
ncbi:MAG: hypothetical protein LBL46_00585 [Rickettsiales bacterium]|jgi:hypothetical protein|nr:hypothetical protein [Rickettsiales bacterium]